LVPNLTFQPAFVFEKREWSKMCVPFFDNVRRPTLIPAEMGFLISSRFASARQLVVSTGVSIRLILHGR
jgi:hypothetical protein